MPSMPLDDLRTRLAAYTAVPLEELLAVALAHCDRGMELPEALEFAAELAWLYEHEYAVLHTLSCAPPPLKAAE